MSKRRKFSSSERNFILQRANGCCEYCLSRSDFSVETFEIEHIVALILDGTNELSNLAFSCGGCNSRKGKKAFAIDPITGENCPLFNPRIDKWFDHFEWKDAYSKVEGLTPIGRATVEQLQLNRHGVVNLRRALYLMGVHPPSF